MSKKLFVLVGSTLLFSLTLGSCSKCMTCEVRDPQNNPLGQVEKCGSSEEKIKEKVKAEFEGYDLQDEHIECR